MLSVHQFSIGILSAVVGMKLDLTVYSLETGCSDAPKCFYHDWLVHFLAQSKKEKFPERTDPIRLRQ